MTTFITVESDTEQWAALLRAARIPYRFDRNTRSAQRTDAQTALISAYDMLMAAMPVGLRIALHGDVPKGTSSAARASAVPDRTARRNRKG